MKHHVILLVSSLMLVGCADKQEEIQTVTILRPATLSQGIAYDAVGKATNGMHFSIGDTGGHDLPMYSVAKVTPYKRTEGKTRWRVIEVVSVPEKIPPPSPIPPAGPALPSAPE